MYIPRSVLEIKKNILSQNRQQKTNTLKGSHLKDKRVQWSLKYKSKQTPGVEGSGHIWTKTHSNSFSVTVLPWTSNIQRLEDIKTSSIGELCSLCIDNQNLSLAYFRCSLGYCAMVCAQIWRDGTLRYRIIMSKSTKRLKAYEYQIIYSKN